MESYGAAGDDGSALKTKVMHKRRRMNVVAIFMSLMVPWLLYCAVYAAKTFSIRITRPWLSNAIVGGCVLVVLLAFALAARQIQMKRSGNPGYEPMWYIFLAITCLIALLFGYGSAELNWNLNMSAFFNMGHLNEYWYVDPARMRGAQMMDAGAVNFVNGTRLNLGYSMGFRNDGVYCVAPITNGDSPLASYDFWAVGKNCCSGSSNDFKCGAYNNPEAHEGMRLLSDSSRAYFRLAVQQAEATYGIRAEHPLFFHWVGNALAEKNAAYATGWAYYMLGMFAYFFFQLFLVTIASICFAKVFAY